MAAGFARNPGGLLFAMRTCTDDVDALQAEAVFARAADRNAMRARVLSCLPHQTLLVNGACLNACEPGSSNEQLRADAQRKMDAIWAAFAANNARLLPALSESDDIHGYCWRGGGAGRRAASHADAAASTTERPCDGAHSFVLMVAHEASSIVSVNSARVAVQLLFGVRDLVAIRSNANAAKHGRCAIVADAATVQIVVSSCWSVGRAGGIPGARRVAWRR